MKIQATHTPADDDLRLQVNEPFCTLARAMISRAFRDSIGKTGVEHASRGDKRYLIMADAAEFFKDGRFEFWCDLLGVNYDIMMRKLFGAD